MFTKPDDATTTALARLGKGAEWTVIEAWLLKSRESCLQGSLNADEVICRKNQGALVAIDEMLKNTRAAVESSTRR